MLTKEQIPSGKLVDYVIASSTCFPAVERKQIDGEYFGRYYDLYHGYDEKIRYEIRDE